MTLENSAEKEYIKNGNGVWFLRDSGIVVAAFGEVTKLTADGEFKESYREGKKQYVLVWEKSTGRNPRTVFFDSEEECRGFLEKEWGGWGF